MTRGRPFTKGNTQGRGRPKGSRNKGKSPAQELLDQFSESLIRKCIFMALQGDQRAMRLCIERILPACGDGYINMSLPSIKTAQDVDRAADKVTQSVRRGKLTPNQGGKVMNILDARVQILEKVQHEIRIEKLEENMAVDSGSGRLKLAG